MPYAKNYPFHPRPDEKDLPSIPVDVPGDEEYLDVLFAPERDKESEETWFHNLKRKWMLDPYAQGLFDYDEKGRNPAGNTTKDTLYHGTGLDNLQIRKSDRKEEEKMEKKLAEKDLIKNYDIFEFIKFINEEDDLHLTEVDINKLYHYAMDDRWENELEAWEFAIIIAMWSEGKWHVDWEPVMIAMDSKKSTHERVPFYTKEDYEELKSEVKQFDKLEDWINHGLMATWLDVEPLKEIWEKAHGKKDLGTIKTSAQYGELDDMALFLSQKKKEEVKTKARELMYIDDEILEKMGLDDEKYQKLVSARFPLSDPEVSEIRDIYLNYVKEYVTEKVPAVIYLILEDNNYHTFNEALAYLNLFDPSIDDITFYHFEEWEGVNASKKLAQEDNEIYCKTETKKKTTEQEADKILQAFNARFDQIEIAGPIYHIYYWIDSDVIKEHWRDIDKAFDGFDYTVKVIQKSSKKLAQESDKIYWQDIPEDGIIGIDKTTGEYQFDGQLIYWYGDEVEEASSFLEKRAKTYDENKKWVNTYEITRHYGGDEEGGWWYNHYDCVDSVQVDVSEVEKTRDEKYKEHEHLIEGDIYSMGGGTDILVYIEDVKAGKETVGRPHYESKKLAQKKLPDYLEGEIDEEEVIISVEEIEGGIDIELNKKKAEEMIISQLKEYYKVVYDDIEVGFGDNLDRGIMMTVSIYDDEGDTIYRGDGVIDDYMWWADASETGINVGKSKQSSKKLAEEKYKTDEEIEKEFKDYEIKSLEFRDSKDSGFIEIYFPEAGESVGGGTEYVVDNFIIYDTGKIAFDNWYPENIYLELVDYIRKNRKTSSKKLAQDFDTTEGRPTVEHKEPLETEEEIDIDEDFFEGEKPMGLTHTPGQKPLTPSREKEVIEVEKDFLRRLTPMDMKEYTQLTNERTEAEAEGDLSKSDYMDHAIKNLLKKYQEAPSTINESSPASFVGRMMKAHTMLNEGDYTVVISAIQDRLTKLKNDMKLKVVSASVYRIDRESDNKAVVDFSLDMMSRQSLTSRNIVVRAFKEGDEIEILPYFWDSLGRQYHFDEAGIKKVFNFVDTTKHVLDEFKEKEEKTN